MLDSYTAQWALRAGASSVGTHLIDGAEHANTIKNTAEKRVNDLALGSNNYPQVSEQLTVQAALISAAVAGIAIAYSSITEQLTASGNQRLAYIKEREGGTSTFIVPTNKEPRDMYKEEKFIKKFVELTAKTTPPLAAYSGHQSTLLPEQNNQFYSVLPFYRMSKDLEQPYENHRLIEKQRGAIGLFLKSAVPNILSELDEPFQEEWRVVSFFNATISGSNYINNFRSARFLIMSLANLLWNLQHPVDPETGYPLNLDDCIKLCRDVRSYLNEVLAIVTGPCFKQMNKSNTLASFVRKIDTQINALWDAYEDERLHEINIDEVTNSAHQALKTMDKSILNLIYRQQAYKSHEKANNAADDLVCTITYLRDLFLINPGLISMFTLNKKLSSETMGLNEPVITVIDAIILFCHMPEPKREALIKRLEKSNLSSVSELALTLKKFSTRFIKPVDIISEEELWREHRDKSYVTRAILTARRLIPLITFILDDYGTDVDTPFIFKNTKTLPQNAGTSSRRNGKQQIEFINKLVGLNDPATHYQLTLSPFINANEQTVSALNKLIRHQGRMKDMTKLLDKISELIHDYRNFLQQQIFQTFLLKCIRRAQKEYNSMNDCIDQLDSNITQDESMPRNLKQILGQMTSEMDKQLTTFTKATTGLNRTIGSPDFPEEQKELLTKKITIINKQFFTLFGEQSGLDELSTTCSQLQAIAIEPQRSGTNISNLTSHFPEEKVQSNKVVALSKLAHSCYDGLSYISRYGYKGLLLRNLMIKIETKPDFTTAQFDQAIKELVSVSASYRETYFFQAAYGKSRSAKILINAIKDPNLNSIFPLASIIFGSQGINYAEQTNDQIVTALENLRNSQHWQASSGLIMGRASFDSTETPALGLSLDMQN